MPVWLQVAVPVLVAIMSFVGGRMSVRASRDNAQTVDTRAGQQQQHEYLRWALERSWSTNAVEARAGLAIVRALRLERGLNDLDRRIVVAALHEINRPVLDQLGEPAAGAVAQLPPPGDPGTSEEQRREAP